MKNDLEKRYQAILQATPDIICEVDKKKNYAWMNEAGANFFGPDAVGRETSFYLCDKGEKHTNIQPLTGDRVFCVQSWHRRKDGEERLLAWWRKIMVNEKGEESGVIYAGRDITERKQAEIEKDKLITNLTMRNRELDALFAFTHLVESSGSDLSKVLRGTPDIICQGWQFPEITRSRITFKEECYTSKDFTASSFGLSRELKISGESYGLLEVFYLEDHGPFLFVERELLDALAESLSKTAERIEASKSIEIEKEKLKEANITLRNILDRVEEDKNSIKENIALNVQKSILPILEELKQSPKSDHTKLALLENNLTEISSDLHRRLVDLKFNLTPTEIEVCRLVKSGYLGKQIAGLLNISYLTVEGHKRNIRRKLKLTNSKVNLQSYLSEIM